MSFEVMLNCKHKLSNVTQLRIVFSIDCPVNGVNVSIQVRFNCKHKLTNITYQFTPKYFCRKIQDFDIRFQDFKMDGNNFGLPMCVLIWLVNLV